MMILLIARTQACLFATDGNFFVFLKNRKHTHTVVRLRIVRSYIFFYRLPYIYIFFAVFVSVFFFLQAGPKSPKPRKLISDPWAEEEEEAEAQECESSELAELTPGGGDSAELAVVAAVSKKARGKEGGVRGVGDGFMSTRVKPGQAAKRPVRLCLG